MIPILISSTALLRSNKNEFYWKAAGLVNDWISKLVQDR